ncbi:MAG: hypothetical protein K0R54_2750 [Clostridiaceae bacterium]|jgi:hypothetical protein|nr:hypothetical protein [Clostridiaceae bacterium]MDF2950468.1 hypothetical protein [Anaerocolumna sp.]
MNLAYYNDHKEKWQSHEISLLDENFYNTEHDVFSHDPFNITGYGETKEEALSNFKMKFEYTMNELKAFETMLLDTSVIEDNIVQVDCFKKRI